MKRKDTLLTLLILGGLALGLIVGQFILYDPGATPEKLAEVTGAWQTAGNIIFIRPLRMMVIPIVFISVVVGVTSIGNPSRLGLVGGATLLFYLSTMLLSVGLGLTLVSAVKPGAGVADPAEFMTGGMEVFEGARERIESGSAGGLGNSFMRLVEQMIPTNPIAAAVDGNTLGVVVFAIFLGLSLVMSGKKAQPVIEVFEGLFDVLIRLVTWIIWLAPLGVFLLVAGRVGEIGLGSLAGPVFKYMMVVIVGLLIHATITLPAVLAIFGRVNPFRYMWQLRKPIITAFSTASSAATLPITIEEAEKSGKCSKSAANFVLPLGATVNMDGTALYQAVAVVFLFQIYGLDLSLAQQLVILITATLAAVGTAAIPSAGLITMAIVITAVNSSLAAMGDGTPTLPLEAIAIILGIDRILDMCRTSVNVWGDAVGARIMTRLAPDEDDELEKALG
ncbi:MAG: dicarboxylate/amino acid:cation symporter [Planctomycetota bacterium]